MYSDMEKNSMQTVPPTLG